MIRRNWQRAVAFAASVAVGLVLAMLGSTAANAAPWQPERKKDLAKVHAATKKYTNVKTALKDGFVADIHCVSSPEGTMGIHYVHPARLDRTVNLRKPEVLVYLPKKNGTLRLVAVEYLVWDADRNVHTDSDRPYLFQGIPFHGPMLGHAPDMPIHYELHVWLYRYNPQGRFAQYNPQLSCPK